MVFNDVRRFGAIDLIRSEKLFFHKWLSKLGPEPLSNNFSSQVLQKKIENKKCSIKAAILDQGMFQVLVIFMLAKLCGKQKFLHLKFAVK